MAMYVTFENGQVAQWHTGNSKDAAQSLKNKAGKVAEVQADGHELEYIINNFTMLPMPKNRRVVTFYGDIAKMIVGHLS